jgi:hypothetical protein
MHVCIDIIEEILLTPQTVHQKIYTILFLFAIKLKYTKHYFSVFSLK